MSGPTASQLREAIESLDIVIGREIRDGILIAEPGGVDYVLTRLDGKWFHRGTQECLSLAEWVVAIAWAGMRGESEGDECERPR